MSTVGAGFDALAERFGRLGIVAAHGSAPPSVPASVLDQPLEPTLARLYAAHDGAWWSAPEFALRVYPLDGPDAIAWRNESLRRSGDDFVPPYPFEELMVFAEVRQQASYLASVPALADGGGRQPVLYLDVHEDPWAIPIASSVDAAFALLARYIDLATASLGRAGLVEIGFPLDVGELIGSDAALRARVASGEFTHLSRGDESIRTWISTTFGQAS